MIKLPVRTWPDSQAATQRSEKKTSDEAQQIFNSEKLLASLKSSPNCIMNVELYEVQNPYKSPAINFYGST